MTGQQPIIAMRRAGQKPDFVWVNDFACKPDSLTVCVDAETPELEDFRFLVGITALVTGTDQNRVDRFFKACSAVAKRVIASTYDPQLREIVRVQDSEGVMSWPT